MTRLTAVTDDDLVRARSDPAFRHRMLAKALGMLLSELDRHRKAAGRPETPALREGAELAVKLADLISRIAPPAAR